MSYAVSDSVTMLRRNLRHLLRRPTSLVMILGVPVLLLLLFVGVFGGALHAGLQNSGHQYVDYVLPGILLMTVGYGASTTALAVNQDLTEGIIARFRTMAIARSSVLTGHVVAAVARTMISLALVCGLAVLLGFRPEVDVVRWLAAAGLLALVSFALTWLAVGAGLAAGSAEATGGFTLIVQVLPFVSSAFVDPRTMSPAVRWFARNEPYTPIIDAVRGLLLGTPVGPSVLLAAIWCAGLALAGYLWSRALFKRDPVR